MKQPNTSFQGDGVAKLSSWLLEGHRNYLNTRAGHLPAQPGDSPQAAARTGTGHLGTGTGAPGAAAARSPPACARTRWCSPPGGRRLRSPACRPHPCSRPAAATPRSFLPAPGGTQRPGPAGLPATAGRSAHLPRRSSATTARPRRAAVLPSLPRPPAPAPWFWGAAVGGGVLHLPRGLPFSPWLSGSVKSRK